MDQMFYPPKNDADYLFKVVILGDSYVGRSRFVLRFTDDQFYERMPSSAMGVEFMVRETKMDEKIIKLQIWDRLYPSENGFLPITKAFYRGSHGFFILYDITNRRSFDRVPFWLSEIKNSAPPYSIPILLGAKADLEERREVQKEEGEKMASEHGILFFEVSSKTSLNVVEAFCALTREMFIKAEELANQTPQNNQVQIQKENPKKHQKCN